MSDEHRTNIPAIAGHMTRAIPVESTRRVLHVASVLWMSALGNSIVVLFSILVSVRFYCFGLEDFHFNDDPFFLSAR